jgi:hypothetical protein
LLVGVLVVLLVVLVELDRSIFGTRGEDDKYKRNSWEYRGISGFDIEKFGKVRFIQIIITFMVPVLSEISKDQLEIEVEQYYSQKHLNSGHSHALSKHAVS